MPFRLVPTIVTAPMMTMAISAAIRPYSIAVTPSSSWMNFWIVFMMKILQLDATLCWKRCFTGSGRAWRGTSGACAPDSTGIQCSGFYLGADVGEDPVQVGTNDRHCADDDDGDQGGDQAIFDCGYAFFVTDEF